MQRWICSEVKEASGLLTTKGPFKGPETNVILIILYSITIVHYVFLCTQPKLYKAVGFIKSGCLLVKLETLGLRKKLNIENPEEL